MDRRPPCSNPEPPRPPSAATQQDEVQPIATTVENLRQRAEEDDIHIFDHHAPPEYQHSQHNTHSSSHHSHSPHHNPSPLYQTVIPAFTPNHYDLRSTTVCLCLPLTIKTPVNRWRERRRSIQELHDREDELRREHAKLKELETRYRGGLPRYEQLPKDNPRVRNEGVEQPRPVRVPDGARQRATVVGPK